VTLRSGILPKAIWLGPPLLAGAALRLWNLAPQILGGDELHAVRSALLERMPEILTTYPPADNCIPLTALDRALMVVGVELSETVVRLPVLVSGFLFLLLVPLAVERRLGTRAAALFAWLAAISPVLVLYSRIARSYMPILLLGAAAAIAFWRFWERPRPLAGAAYVLAAALAVWFHLVAAPFVAAPFLYALGDLAWGEPARRERGRRLGALLLLAGALAVACAAFLVPARRSLVELVAHKHWRQPLLWKTLGELLRLQAGTARWVPAALFWLAAAAGLALLARRDRRLAAYTAVLAAAQVAGVYVLSPIGLTISIVLDRYLLLVLPLALLWVATALAALSAGPSNGERRLGRAAGTATVALFLVLLLACGPFADPRFRSSSFMHHNDFVAFCSPRSRLPAAAIPPFYRWLAGVPGGGAIVEFPWVPQWTWSSIFYIDQEIHGRRTLVASPVRRLYRPGIALRNLIAPYPAPLCASGARFVAVHLHIAHEEDLIERPADWMVEPMDMPLRRALRTEGEGMARRLAALWGPPVYHDAAIAVWDLLKTCGPRGGDR